MINQPMLNEINKIIEENNIENIDYKELMKNLDNFNCSFYDDDRQKQLLDFILTFQK